MRVLNLSFLLKIVNTTKNNLNHFIGDTSKKILQEIKHLQDFFYLIGSKLIAVPPPGAKFKLIFDLLVTSKVFIL